METDKMLQIPEIVKAEETLKLMKMSKGYNWEIKIFIREGCDDDKAMTRLELLNTEMMKRFGSLTE